MSRAKVVNKTDAQRKSEWESGRCPYCGSDNFDMVPISKKIRGYDKPVIGTRYYCCECEQANQFTERIK